MTHRILLIQGHPDTSKRHLNHLLLDAYAQGAAAAGHETRTLVVADLEFPLLRTQDDWETGTVPAGLADAQADILWADHLVLFFPLWLGDMPALLKGFLEQVARPGFAFHRDARNPFGAKALGGRSARVIVTMGMPALVYRWYFRAHSVKALERNVLGFIGIAPVRETLIGMVAGMAPEKVTHWEATMRKLGGRAQ
jgi:putative NADPH-quinone reductase